MKYFRLGWSCVVGSAEQGSDSRPHADTGKMPKNRGSNSLIISSISKHIPLDGANQLEDGFSLYLELRARLKRLKSLCSFQSLFTLTYLSEMRTLPRTNRQVDDAARSRTLLQTFENSVEDMSLLNHTEH